MLLPLTTSSPQPIFGKLQDALSFGFNQINEIIQKVPAWPTEPVVENNYEAKGQMIKLDMNRTKWCNGLYIEFRQNFAKETFSYDEHLKS